MGQTPAWVAFEPQTSGPVVRRSWKLVAGPDGPVLTGLFGFPWRTAVVQAKCTDTLPSGAGTPGRGIDRWHAVVPSPHCTCGIYATEQPNTGRLQRHLLRNSVVVTGFVRLSGRVLQAESIYRAEQAQIVGPLTITLPGPSLLRRLGARWGMASRVERVTPDGDRWLFHYRSGRRGVSVGEWYRQMGEALRLRYGVEIVGLVSAPRAL